MDHGEAPITYHSPVVLRSDSNLLEPGQADIKRADGRTGGKAVRR
jgi:hypothetical protein